MDEFDAEIQSLTALLADEEPRVLKVVEDSRKALATARRSWTRLKRSRSKSKAEARETAKARVLELEEPQKALTKKKNRLIALESKKASRIRAHEATEHNARVPTFLQLPRNVLDDILYSAMVQTQASEGSCMCSHKNNWNIGSRNKKPWEVGVMRVCKALHDHVVASPAMWTFISMAVSGSSPAIQTYISRSGCLKLHISLKVCSDRIERLPGYDPRFALLARNIHRIQVLCISCDGYRALNVATIPFHHLTAPSLIRLHLSFDFDEYRLSDQEDEFNIPITSEDHDSAEFPLPDAEGAAALRAGIVLVAEAPVLSTVCINNGYFARDLPFLTQVETFCLTHGVSYEYDMELTDVQYLGHSDALRESIRQLVVSRDMFGYRRSQKSEPANLKGTVPHLPSLCSLFLLSPLRGKYHNLWMMRLPKYNILHSLTAPDLSNLGFFHDEGGESDRNYEEEESDSNNEEEESDSDEEEAESYTRDPAEWYLMSVPDMLRIPLHLPSRQPKFPQLKRLVAIHSGGLQIGDYNYYYYDDDSEVLPWGKPRLKVLPDMSRAVKCRYAPFPNLEELMVVDDVRMGLIEGILGYKDSLDNPEPCRYPKFMNLTIGVHREPYLLVDLARLEKLLRARHDAGAPLTSVRFVGHAIPETEEEEAESQRICQRIRDLGVEDVQMHHGSAMLYMFLEEMFSEELVCYLKGLRNQELFLAAPYLYRS